MSTAAHTPGPWTTGGHDIKANNGNILVGAIFHSLSPAGEKDSEAIANARLIAAAPDLLAALKEYQSLCERMGALHPSRDFREVLTDPSALAVRTQILITKAEGRS